jgi:DNA-binding MarR family transcriptional regulator
MAFHGCVQYLVDVSTIGKRFLGIFVETKRVVSLVAARMMAPLGLGRAQVALLRELGQSGPATLSALAHATMLDPSAAARSLTVLSNRGWIRRRRGELDRRESYVELTARGRRFVARVEVTYSGIARLLSARLDDRDITDLERICAKLSPLAAEPAVEPGRKPRRPGGRTAHPRPIRRALR